MFVADTIASIEQSINSCLEKISEWCSFNKLLLNIEKSKAMKFTHRKYDISSFLLGNRIIDVVDSFKYLAVHFDSKLNFNECILALCKKLLTYCGISYRLR